MDVTIRCDARAVAFASSRLRNDYFGTLADRRWGAAMASRMSAAIRSAGVQPDQGVAIDLVVNERDRVFVLALLRQEGGEGPA